MSPSSARSGQRSLRPAVALGASVWLRVALVSRFHITFMHVRPSLSPSKRHAAMQWGRTHTALSHAASQQSEPRNRNGTQQVQHRLKPSAPRWQNLLHVGARHPPTSFPRLWASWAQGLLDYGVSAARTRHACTCRAGKFPPKQSSDHCSPFAICADGGPVDYPAVHLMPSAMALLRPSKPDASRR